MISDNKTRRHTKIVIDKVIDVSTSTIYSPLSPHKGKEIWIVKCINSKLIVLPEIMENGRLLTKVISGSIINKNFRFIVTIKGRYIVDAEQFEDGE
ncbi:MAG: hypothetical protein AD073_000264 [Mycoplasmataceae bacterium]|nr:MAG: hypothetical protein AD073_000264 [Mycoplasmataceae bacterium]